jgi:primosomal protein N' (replication factor Y)
MTKSSVVEVALLRRLPRLVRVFDYLLAESSGFKVESGDLVQVPFRNQLIPGVVVAAKSSSAVPLGRLKAVASILAKQYITPHQLWLADKISVHYGVALGSVLEMFVPFLPNSRFSPSLETNRFGLNKKNRTSRQPLAIMLERLSARPALLKSLAATIVARRQQLLLLVPEMRELNYWQEVLADHFKIVTYSADLPLTAKRSVWQAVKDGQAQIVIGTRAALFLPWRALGGIVMDDSANDNYKQFDQNPRYDGPEVAGWLAEFWGASLAYLSAGPSLTSRLAADQKKLGWKKFGAKAEIEISLVDLAQERQAGNKQILSYELQEKLQTMVAAGKKVFLYLNRRGTATAVLCRDCGYMSNCSKCGRPLAYEARSNKLVCYNCGLLANLPLPCPVCRSLNIKYLGTGLSRLEAELAHTWPKLKPLVLEGEVSQSASALAKSAQLVIGSRAAWRYLDLKSFSLIALILPDAELAIPEFGAAEQVWQTARYLAAVGAEQLIIQTYRPEHYVWQSIIKKDSRIFYQAELEQRKLFDYPPFVRLIRFTVQASSETEAVRQARQTQRLIVPQLGNRAKLVGPYADYYRQVRGRWRYHLLLRYQTGFKPEALWSLLPDDVIIDRHPRTVLS